MTVCLQNKLIFVFSDAVGWGKKDIGKGCTKCKAECRATCEGGAFLS